MIGFQGFPVVSTLSVWNTFQTCSRQCWMPQINVTESNAVFLNSPPPYAFVFLPKYRLLCYRWDYINGEHNTPGPHVHTLTIYYETLDRTALKSLQESVFLSRPRPQRWMDTLFIKRSYLGVSQSQEGVFLTSYLFECGGFYDGALGRAGNGKLLYCLHS